MFAVDFDGVHNSGRHVEASSMLGAKLGAGEDRPVAGAHVVAGRNSLIGVLATDAVESR